MSGVDSWSGMQQKNVVVDMFTKWNISGQITGVAVDTTRSNTGQERGACKLIEDYLDKSVLWIACHCCHHIYDLHINYVAEAVTGNTKDPGIKMSKKLFSISRPEKMNLGKTTFPAILIEQF